MTDRHRSGVTSRVVLIDESETSHGIQAPTRRSPIRDGKLRSRLDLGQHVEKMHAWSLVNGVQGTAPA